MINKVRFLVRATPAGKWSAALPEWALDATQPGSSLSCMSRNHKRFSASRPAPKKQIPIVLVTALAAAGGLVIGSAGTYFLSKRLASQKQSALPVTGGTPQVQTITLPPQQQFTPAPQPPGEVPPGKVWSVEHGHWHDIPATLTIPAPATVAPASATVTPAPAPIPAPEAKKE